MKCLKILGLAAIMAAALTALAGAGTASATVFCPTTSTPCQPKSYDVGTSVDAKLTGTATFENGKGETLTTCTEGTVKGKIGHRGSETETVLGTIETLTWGNCTAKPVTVAGGFYEVHGIAGSDNGTVTGGNTEVTLPIFGVSCTYSVGREDLGTLNGGLAPTLEVAVILSKTAGGFLCPEHPIWEAQYKFAEPVPLYVEVD